MKKPLLIGITPRGTTVYQSEASYNINGYVDYLRSTGIPVLPFVLPVCGYSDAAEAASCLDGLLITGGQDVSPALYGETNEGLSDCEPELYDGTDLHLYTAFQSAGKPVFGICRGIQLINAAEGGTLIQDIPSLNDAEHNQRNVPQEELTGGTLHSVSCVPGTRMHGIFGKQTRVNSFHHQAVDMPAPGFTVSAYAPDGIIEAIEKDRVFAVQWHPERMLDNAAQVELAAQFLKLCAGSDK